MRDTGFNFLGQMASSRQSTREGIPISRISSVAHYDKNDQRHYHSKCHASSDARDDTNINTEP
jgi:hypothetical protein